MNGNFTIIENLLDKKESERLKFFPSYNPETICRSIAALANSNGGDILIGVDEKGKILGVESAEEIVRCLTDEIKTALVPEVALFADVFSNESKKVILIAVWEGSKKPYLVDGDIYVIRNGDITTATAKELNGLLSQRTNSDKNWEREIVVGSSVSDIDTDEVMSLMSKTNDTSVSPIDFLQQQGLVRAGSVTNAGIVLFGNRPDKYLPQVRTRLNVFTGASELAHSMVYSCNLFKMIRAIMDDLDDIYGHRILIDGLYRKEVNAYPRLAFREALLNSLIHRDIASPDCYVTISVYPTHTDVVNKGCLMQGVTVNSLKKEHQSVLRNPDIAYFTYLNGLIEMAGSGTLRMIADCQDNSFPVPKWTAFDDSVKVTFVGVKSKTDKPILVNNDSFLLNRSSGKRDEIRKVVSFMKKNGGKAKTKDIEAVIGKSLPTIRRLIKVMVSEGIIVYVGSIREGCYYLTADEQ